MARKPSNGRRPKLLRSVSRSLLQWPDVRLLRWAAIATILSLPLTAGGLLSQRPNPGPEPPLAAAVAATAGIEHLAIVEPQDGAVVADVRVRLVARTPYPTWRHYLVVETLNGRIVDGGMLMPSPTGELEGRFALGDAVAGAGETFTLYLIATTSRSLDLDHLPDDAVVGRAVHVRRAPLFEDLTEGGSR